jgi:hypothetical protein
MPGDGRFQVAVVLGREPFEQDEQVGVEARLRALLRTDEVFVMRDINAKVRVDLTATSLERAIHTVMTELSKVIDAEQVSVLGRRL